MNINFRFSPPEVWRAGGFSQPRWYEIPRLANASTSTTSTQRWQDFALGKIVKVGTTNYVKVADDQWLAMENPLCNDPVLLYPGSSKSFDYTGGEQTYTTYANCQYKLEVWGASGGDHAYYTEKHHGGYGAYSTGVINHVGTVYINVGGKGPSATTTSTSPYPATTGGYNGGGNSPSSANYWERGAGGGGATSIALNSGLLSTLSSHATDGRILIVGSGGGAASCNDAYCGRVPNYTPDRCDVITYGHGGGIQGNTYEMYCSTVWYSDSVTMHIWGYGGTQSIGGSGLYKISDRADSEGGKGTFGLGADVSRGGGGGGYFGGGCASVCGGGSGYIGSSNLISAGGVTKHMTCYDCAESSDANTRTISNNCASATATPDCSKTGNGYARITRLN